MEAGGWDVALGLKRRVYVDKAVDTAVHTAGARLVLISDLRVLIYVLRIVCSLSVTPVSAPAPLSVAEGDVGSLKAASSWLQYHSHSQSSAVWTARFSSASEGMCLWTMQ